MKLRWSPTSPYTRKVTITAHELGLDSKIQRIVTNTSDPKSDHPGDNPLGKVPALILDDGQRLYDSPVICEYLDHSAGGKLFPKSGAARWTALRQQAIGDGVMDATIARMMEVARRPEPLRWPQAAEKQAAKVKAALDLLEQEVDMLAGPLTIGQIAVGSALDYLGFRFPDEDWRSGRPKLAKWFAEFAKRPSMQATLPKNL